MVSFVMGEIECNFFFIRQFCKIDLCIKLVSFYKRYKEGLFAFQPPTSHTHAYGFGTAMGVFSSGHLSQKVTYSNT